MQNMPPSILEMFRSRYGKDGVIVEMDFSQLEVVVQAYITGSEIMKQDIANKVDFHCLRLSYAEGMDYDKVVELCSTEDTWKNKRKKAKVVSFQKAYGAHSSKIAVSAGLKEATVEEIFRKEDERYPEISAFYDDVLGTLESNKYGLDMKQEVRQTNGKYAPHPTKSQATGQRHPL
jgi:DNA polymerase I-like protein with 3'-5' exonuclease and polymerase domains